MALKYDLNGIFADLEEQVKKTQKQYEEIDETKENEEQENPEEPGDIVNPENPGSSDTGNVDSGKKPTVNNNLNTSKLPQTGDVNILFTLALAGASVTIGGISLKKKKL